mmetsp:Transcript_35960/g.78453  ORF Transcript_35960/g.78453 Transcript_35960/m.78453 type:complete len:203 (+) Transcript_35960:99-707(+)
MTESKSTVNTVETMVVIFTGLYSTLVFLYMFLTSAKQNKKGKMIPKGGDFLPPKENGSKRSAEILSLVLSACWISTVGVVIATKAFEQWKEWEYMYYCVGCAAPFVLFPLLRPAEADRKTPLSQRYIMKFNLWIAIFSFIGNYWYGRYTTRVYVTLASSCPEDLLKSNCGAAGIRTTFIASYKRTTPSQPTASTMSPSASTL